MAPQPVFLLLQTSPAWVDPQQEALVTSGPKLKPSVKVKGKSAQCWSDFAFFIVEGNYSRLLGNSILVESCCSLEAAFREPPQQASEGTRTKLWV